jgi:LPXTG-motif cell wall-anchored protein
VRSIGVASAAAALALGVAGSAFACSITEFSASASCDSDHGVITVLNKDVSHTAVNITVSQGGTQVGSQENVRGSQVGVPVKFSVDWAPNTVYTVHVVKSAGGEVGSKEVTTPDTACAAPPVTTPATTPSDTPTATPSDTSAPTTSAPATTSPAAAVDDTNAPSPAGGTSNLAETGGGSNTGMIAGIAAVFVAVGGGAVFMLRRRNPAARH